jgi:putative transcriptional regulator
MPSKGRLLVAAPGLADPNFHRAVVYILDHGETGTVGVVLNHPTDTSVDDVVPLWGLLSAAPAVVFGGGPVSITGAICLARLAEAEIAVGGAADMSAESSGFQLVTNCVGTADLKLAPEDLPVRLASARVFAGYAGWGPAQLEAELDADAWFVVDADDGDVFCTAPEELWATVLRRQGGWFAVLARHPVDPSMN